VLGALIAPETGPAAGNRAAPGATSDVANYGQLEFLQLFTVLN
jgi:hypothetical protein